jgi:maltooligosyltrehalose trehalohydrolase
MDGMWNEDWHHSAFVTLTGLREAYFTDYFGTAHEFAAMARWNLLYQGQWYTWQKQGRGSDARHIPASNFVCFLENHDQVANTDFGRRLYCAVDQGLWRAMTTLLFLGPGVPMLFQGQERAVPEPFTYFADHEGDLGAAVRKGREEFLAQFPTLRDPDVLKQIAPPADEDAFRTCQIAWTQSRKGDQAWQLHVDLLALRRTDPVIAQAGTPEVTIASSAPTPTILIVRYQRNDEERLILLNLGVLTTLRMNDPLLAPPHGQTWSPMLCSEHVDYGGRGIAESFGEGPWTLQAHCAWLLRNVPAAAPPV